MLKGKNTRKAVALAGVLAVAVGGATAVGLWGGAVGPASTDAALVDSAAAMDLDAGVCIGELLEDFGLVTLPEPARGHRCGHPPAPWCINPSGPPDCCWTCNGHVICLQ